MIRGAQTQDIYYRFQAVEVRNTHNGRETWRPAKIHRRTSRGCEVIYNEGPQTPQHIMFPDLRPMEKPAREPVKLGRPLLTAEDIDRINASAEAEARAKSEAQAANQQTEPAPQALVLVKRQSDPPAPAPIALSGRRKRKPIEHTPTPLSEALRKARIAKGLQQREAAQLAKLPVLTRLSTYESGDVPPTDDDLLGLSIALDLDLDHLLELRDGAKSEPEKPSTPDEWIEPEAEPIPEPRAHYAAPEVVRMRVELTQLRDENATLRAARTRSEPTGGSHEVAQLREENAILRAAVVFYAGRES